MPETLQNLFSVQHRVVSKLNGDHGACRDPCVPAETSCEMAWTFPELDVVAPEARMMSPALVRALFASGRTLPTTLGTVQGVSGFLRPRYKMMEALLGT